jgi:hypothetical protein
VLVCAEDDLPYVPFGQRLPIFEPLDHLRHEFVRYAVFSVRERQFGTSISLFDVAPTCITPANIVQRPIKCAGQQCAPSAIIS